MQVANNPLFIEEDLSANNNEVRRGSVATRRIVVKNLGDRKAEVDIWIAATDEKSEPLLRWCIFSEQNPLRLEPRESHEVSLTFEVPLQATPDIYNYEILLEAPYQYPDRLVRRPQQLRVLLTEQDTEWGSEPGFTLQPVTNSANPHPLKAREPLDVKVKVENRSKRVDRFYLTCPDLHPEWFTIRYPESSLQLSGLVKETDGLELNPGSVGEITLQLHPPQYTPAGNYFPTIRLLSTNKEDLVLLDVMYLKLLPDDSLEAELHPLLRKVPTEAGEFDLELTNQGNINRELTILAGDREGLFTYTPEPPSVRLSPGEISNVALRVKPKKWRWWRRPFWGIGLEIDFDVELENANQLLLPETSKPPALPKDSPRGTLIWESRPLWLLWLLIALALFMIGAIAFSLWLYFFPPSPKVLSFDSMTSESSTKQKKIYQEGYGDAIRLNWEISQLSHLDKVTVIRMDQNVEADRKSYFFDGKIPPHLLRRDNQKNNFCEKSQNQTNKDILICKGIITTAKKAGNYIFKIQVFSKHNQKTPSDSQITDTITINPVTPLPLPKIVDFSSTKPTYEEVSASQSSSSPTQKPELATPSSRPTPGPILLNWELSNPNHIQEIDIVSLAPDGSINSELKRYEIKNNALPPELRNYCETKENLSQSENLVCRNVPTDARRVGDYIFKLTVISQGQQESTNSKQTATIKIQPLPIPKVTDFSSTEPVYEAVSPESPQSSASQGAAFNTSQTATPGTSSSRPLPSPIYLNWEIANPGQIKELKVVGLAPDGSINSKLQRYPFTNNDLPPELKSFCILTTSLICRRVPTDARQVGDYTFKLTVLGSGQETPEITKNTALIKIKPEPPTPLNIISFKINGQDVSEKPKFTYLLSKERDSVDIVFSWQVQNGKDTKVELLPTPGLVSAQGSLNYTLSKPPSSATITLKVTNSAGEQKTQSVVIETVEPSHNSQSPKSSSGSGSQGSSSPGGAAPEGASPSPVNPGIQSPIELPPQPD